MNLTSKSFLKKSFLVLFLFVMVIDRADGAEQIYYSINIATLKSLKEVNQHVNSLKLKGKLVFWEETKVQGLGIFYRVYLGRYRNWDDAVAFRKKLKKTGTVSNLGGIQWFIESGVADEKETSSLDVALKKPNVVPQSSVTKDKNRFIDNQDGTITDTKTGLMWIKNGWRFEFLSAATWFDAMAKIEAFKHGGYSDWRLPRLEEWSSLIDKNYQNPALVEPNPFTNIIGHMPYWTITEFIYSQNSTCMKQCPTEAYVVMLYSGNIHHQKKIDRAFILPVRSMNQH
ncbi:DUF1566 domain-containing protein [Thermodesulfobacteriota bacterium]